MNKVSCWYYFLDTSTPRVSGFRPGSVCLIWFKFSGNSSSLEILIIRIASCTESQVKDVKQDVAIELHRFSPFRYTDVYRRNSVCYVPDSYRIGCELLFKWSIKKNWLQTASATALPHVRSVNRAVVLVASERPSRLPSRQVSPHEKGYVSYHSCMAND